jgi:hypothetical protein
MACMMQQDIYIKKKKTELNVFFTCIKSVTNKYILRLWCKSKQFYHTLTWNFTSFLFVSVRHLTVQKKTESGYKQYEYKILTRFCILIKYLYTIQSIIDNQVNRKKKRKFLIGF